MALYGRRIRPCEGTAQTGSRIDGTIRVATAINSMVGFSLHPYRGPLGQGAVNDHRRRPDPDRVHRVHAFSRSAPESSSGKARRAWRRHFRRTSRPTCKPTLFNPVIVLAFAAVVFLMIRVDLVTKSRLGTARLFVGIGLGDGRLAARTAWIARARLDRAISGGGAGYLSPYSLAGGSAQVPGP